MIERKAVKVFHLVMLEGSLRERKPKIDATYLREENAISDMNWYRDQYKCGIIEDICFIPEEGQKIVFQDGELPETFSGSETKLIKLVKSLFHEWRKTNPLKDEDWFNDDVINPCMSQAYYEIEKIDPTSRSKDLDDPNYDPRLEKLDPSLVGPKRSPAPTSRFKDLDEKVQPPATTHGK